MNPTISIVAQGAMGAGVGGRLVERGLRVITSLAGRSEASARRAKAAGMVAVSDEECLQADFFLSICPPSDAMALAGKMAALIAPGRKKPIYVDCNAVSPQTKVEIGDVILKAGAPFVDVGIIGLPPKGGHSPCLHASGPDAAKLGVLNDFGIKVNVIEGPIGAASALKMSYGAITKGITALGSMMMLAATRAGVADKLRAELDRTQPALVAHSSARCRTCSTKPIASSARWKKSRTSSARISRRSRCTRPSPSSILESRPTMKAGIRRSARLPSF